MVLQPQPLPANTYNPSTQASLYHAYEHCLAMEAASEGNAIHARCIGYLIRELPPGASALVASDLASCNSDFGKVCDLSEFYVDHLFRLCELSSLFGFKIF